MSGDWPEKEKREASEVLEILAQYEAMPLRVIVATEIPGKLARLDCGHNKALFNEKFAGDLMRCLLCYEAGLRKAQEMVERLKVRRSKEL